MIVELTFEETLKFERTVRVEMEESTTDDQIEKMLDQIEQEAQQMDDALYKLRKHQLVKKVGSCDTDYNSPDDMSLEASGYDELGKGSDL